MRKMMFLMVFFSLLISNIEAQETTLSQTENLLFEDGKSLYDQKKYEASTKTFEQYMKLCTNKQSGKYQEAAYFICCNAYEMKKKEAAQQLKDYLILYPYAPQRTQVYYMLGRLAYEKKRYAESLKWYNQIKNNSQLSKNDNIEFLYTKGYCHIMEKQYRQASYIFESLMGRNSKYREDAIYYYAYAEFCQKNYKIASSEFKKLLQNSKYAESSSYHLLQINQQEGNYEEIIVSGQELLTKYPKSKYNSEAYKILGEAYYHQGNYKNAIDYLLRYDQTEKKVQRTDMYMLGMSYYNKKQYKEAISSLSKVTTEKDSLTQNAYMFVGNSYLKQDNPTNARMSFQAASLMNFDPKLKEEALYNYALATYESDAPFGEMVGAFDRFIKEYPNSNHLDEIYGYLASVYMNEKNYAAAVESIDKMRTKNPKMLQAKEHALFQLGVSDFLKRNYNGALNYFSQSIELYTSKSFSAQAFLWRGETYYRLGNLQACRENIKAFLNKPQPKTEEELLKAYYTLGYSYFDAKEYNNARAWFSLYHETENNNLTKYYHDVLNRLDVSYYVTRHFVTAKNFYGKVNPNSITSFYAPLPR